MINHRIIFSLTVFVPFYLACSDNKVKRIKSNDSIVEGNFINGTVIDGKASYYNSAGTLLKMKYRIFFLGNLQE
jgi:hypothetical protein